MANEPFVPGEGGEFSLARPLNSLPTSPELISVDADITQVIVVAQAGVPVRGPDAESPNGWFVKVDDAFGDDADVYLPYLPSAGKAYIMAHGYTRAAKGFPMNGGEGLMLSVSNLHDMDFDSDVTGCKFYAVKA